MEKAKDKLGTVGKRLDESLNTVKKATKEVTKNLVKAAVRKSAKGVGAVAQSVGKGIENKAKDYSKKIKHELGIKDEMTVGQKTGAVVEKIVDLVGVGISKVAEKIDATQAKRFATAQELKVGGYDVLIGEAAISAISINRAEDCKTFVQQIQSNKKILPYQLKDVRKEILNDIIRSASKNLHELLHYLRSRGDLKTKAEIDYLNRKIKIIEQKIKETENENKN